MNATELIAKLQAFVLKFGDLPVRVGPLANVAHIAIVVTHEDEPFYRYVKLD